MMTSSDPFEQYKADLVRQTDPTECPLGLQMMTFFGRSGSGKTTVAASFPHHIYLDLEASATEHSVNAWPWGKTWARFKELIELTLRNHGGPLEGRTLIIDPVSELWGLCLQHELAERKLTQLPDDFGRTLVAIRQEFSRVMGMLLKLRMDQRMGTIFIAHEDPQEVVTPLGRQTVFKPKTDDKAVAAWVSEKAQMILRFSIEDIDPISKQPFPQTRWIIRSKPITSSDVVKDRTNRLPAFMPAKYESILRHYNGADTSKTDNGETEQ